MDKKSNENLKKVRTTVNLDKRVKEDWDKRFGSVLTISAFTELNMKRHLYGEESIKAQKELLKETSSEDNSILKSALITAAQLQAQKEKSLLENEAFMGDAREWWKSYTKANNNASLIGREYAENLKKRIISDYSITIADLVWFAEKYLTSQPIQEKQGVEK